MRGDLCLLQYFLFVMQADGWYRLVIRMNLMRNECYVLMNVGTVYMCILYTTGKGISFESICQVHLKYINILIYELRSCHVPFHYVPSKYICVILYWSGRCTYISDVSLRAVWCVFCFITSTIKCAMQVLGSV